MYPGTLANVSLALAHAHLGDLKSAEALIAQCDVDSDDCMIARGQIARMRGQSGRADYWFARVEKAEPSVPFADAAWGQALDGTAATMAALSPSSLLPIRKVPHFSDPLEMWGETLMLQKHPDQARDKFAEANKYAPNWGCLHLKWGEALVYAGKKDEAKLFSMARCYV